MAVVTHLGAASPCSGVVCCSCFGPGPLIPQKELQFCFGSVPGPAACISEGMLSVYNLLDIVTGSHRSLSGWGSAGPCLLPSLGSSRERPLCCILAGAVLPGGALCLKESCSSFPATSAPGPFFWAPTFKSCYRCLANMSL